jgi:hypothetical protein
LYLFTHSINPHYSIETMSALSTITLTSGGSVSIDASGGGLMSLQTTSGSMQLVSGNNMQQETANLFTTITPNTGSHTTRADVYMLKTSDGVGTWFTTVPLDLFVPVAHWLLPPLITVPVNIIRFFRTIQLADQVTIASEGVDGHVRVGPYLAVGAGNIMAGDPARGPLDPTTIMRLQKYSALDTLDVRATIANLDTGLPLVLSDSDGVNIASATSTLVTTATSITATVGTTVLVVNAAGVTITGNLNVSGNIDNAGTISSTGGMTACCGSPSDLRVKQEFDPMDPEDSLNRMISIPLRTFVFTPEFVETNPGTPTDLQRGVWAQDIEPLIPQAVARGKRVIGPGQVLTDFLTLNKAEMIPE